MGRLKTYTAYTRSLNKKCREKKEKENTVLMNIELELNIIELEEFVVVVSLKLSLLFFLEEENNLITHINTVFRSIAQL